MRNVSFLPVTVPYCWLRAGCMIETKEQKVVLMVMSLTLWMASYYCGTAVTVPVLWLIFYTLLLVYPLWMYELCLHVFVPYFVHYITISVCPLFLHSSFLFRSVSPLFIAFYKTLIAHLALSSYPSQKEDNLCYCCKDRWMLQKLYSMKNVWYLYSKLNRGILDVILKYPHVSSPLVLRNHISQLSLLLNTGQEAQCILLLCFHCLPSCANTLGLALRKEIWVLSNVLL